jgi:type IV secretion system protein TrbL
VTVANTLVGQFQAAIAGIYGAVLPIAQNLFILLSAIMITWSLIWWILEKDDPVPIFVGLLKNLMRISFFWFVLLNASSLSQSVITSFRMAGQAAASAAGSPTASLDPAAMVATGASLANQLLSNVNISGVLGTIGGALIGGLLALLMFVAFLVVAAQMAIALVEVFLVMAGGVLLLGFLGSPWTARFGLSYFTALVGSGVKLFMIYIIAGIGSALVGGWSSSLTSGVNLTGALTVIGVAAIFALATWMIPNYAQALASGTVSTSLNTVMSSAAGLAATASGARVPLALVARASSAVNQGIALGRDRYTAGAGVLRAAGAGAGHVLASPFRAAAQNLGTRHSYRRVGAADIIRRERGL